LNRIFFEVLEYPVTYLEFISVLFGIIAVYLAAKEKIWTWPIGLVNIGTAFFLFYQVQLYSDMFLQIYFFGIGIYGWYSWKSEKKENVPLKWLSHSQVVQLSILIVACTLLLGWCMTYIHIWWSTLFPKPAAYPFADTFIAVGSIIANTLLAKRYIENWILWIVIDIICVFVYFDKNIRFIGLEYLIFLGLAIYGAFHWINLDKEAKKPSLNSL
jgi:nicotinamide mononucleotide transporter